MCGTDFALASGELGPTRRTLGYEGVRRVTAIGSAVNNIDPSGRVGLRVGVTWIRDSCGSCGFCAYATKPSENRCVQQHYSSREVHGTFAEYTIAPARYLLKLPEDMEDDDIAHILYGGVTAYKALKTCDLLPGQ